MIGSANCLACEAKESSLQVRQLDRRGEGEMFSLEKILLPVDFSDHSKGAARYAKALASRTQAQLTLMHVVEMPFGGAILDVTHVTQAQEQLETFLKDRVSV